MIYNYFPGTSNSSKDCQTFEAGTSPSTCARSCCTSHSGGRTSPSTCARSCCASHSGGQRLCAFEQGNLHTTCDDYTHSVNRVRFSILLIFFSKFPLRKCSFVFPFLNCNVHIILTMSLQFAQPKGDDQTLCVDEWPFLQTEFCEVKDWGGKKSIL